MMFVSLFRRKKLKAPGDLVLYLGYFVTVWYFAVFLWCQAMGKLGRALGSIYSKNRSLDPDLRFQDLEPQKTISTHSGVYCLFDIIPLTEKDPGI